MLKALLTMALASFAAAAFSAPVITCTPPQGRPVPCVKGTRVTYFIDSYEKVIARYKNYPDESETSAILRTRESSGGNTKKVEFFVMCDRDGPGEHRLALSSINSKTIHDMVIRPAIRGTPKYELARYVCDPALKPTRPDRWFD